MAASTEAATPQQQQQDATAPPLKTALGALALGVLFDYLFYGRPLGVSVPLFVWLALYVSAALAWRHGRPPSAGQLAAGAGSAAFAAFAAWRAAPELMLANLAASAYLFVLTLSPWLRERDLSAFEARDYVSSAAEVFGESVRLGRSEARRAVADVRSDRLPLRAAATGALLALPMLALFLTLMLSADLVFKSLFERVIGEFAPFSLAVQAALTGGVAVLALGAAAWLKHTRPGSAPSPWAALAKSGRPDSWGFVESSVAAGLTNALFAAFAGVQVLFLVGGKERIEALGTGITYSDYARQGFWEMIFIGALALAACLALDERCEADTPRRRAIKRAHVVAASLSTALMMLSAAYRLWLYEEAYGFTVLRFYSHTFTGFVAVLFLLLCVKSLGDRGLPTFMRHGLVASLSLLGVWNASNPHHVIASANLAAAERGLRPLDAHYLLRLSDDAIEPLLRAAPLIAKDGDRRYHEAALRGRLLTLGDRFRNGGWPALHWAHVRAFRRLDAGVPLHAASHGACVARGAADSPDCRAFVLAGRTVPAVEPVFDD
ncbi:MAG: DUF4173 domain-containing protein [Elusimicrobia bacterium]|nr:DUF4173 domain-containing protein [Elusimicrobiota bacterium]